MPSTTKKTLLMSARRSRRFRRSRQARRARTAGGRAGGRPWSGGRRPRPSGGPARRQRGSRSGRGRRR
ncbi:MAG: hypothetical protein F4164_11710 [Gemmatimonadales bacterium]|nr:hypothetical protein [Gemmatimonadales bacterium]MYG49998.1 hypothetical protein [Gemmatimonadales bacterium]